MTNFTTIDSTCYFGESEGRYVILNITPSNRTDVDCFSITNLQNNETIKVKPTEGSVTVCLEPGMVNFAVDTVYTCPFTSNPVQFTVEMPGECSYNLL